MSMGLKMTIVYRLHAVHTHCNKIRQYTCWILSNQERYMAAQAAALSKAIFHASRLKRLQQVDHREKDNGDDIQVWTVASSRWNKLLSPSIQAMLHLHHKPSKKEQDHHVPWYMNVFGSKREQDSPKGTPDIIISTDDSTAATALYYKTQYPTSKTIHLGKPSTNIEKFDHVVIPKYEWAPLSISNKLVKFENVIGLDLPLPSRVEMDVKKIRGRMGGIKSIEGDNRRLTVFLSGSSR